MSTTTELARRPSATPPASAQPGAALELRSGQVMWTKDQHAALVAMGIPRQASSAELGVFLHQCQRTGLDPFSRQIYLIYRDSLEDGKWVKKPTTQVGIDGFRVIRDRVARRDGLRVEYEDTTWYASDGQAFDVWLWNEPPAACKVTVVIDGRRFPAVLRFAEYAQKKKGGELNKMWTEKPAHMIEKCCEADALRKAFPNDMAGVILEDAAPLAEDAPPERQRVTAEQARARRPQQVRSEVVDVVPPEDAPWPGDAAPAQPEPQDEPEGDPRDRIRTALAALGIGSSAAVADYVTQMTGVNASADLANVPREQCEDVLRVLADVTTRKQLDALLKDGEVPGHGE